MIMLQTLLVLVTDCYSTYNIHRRTSWCKIQLLYYMQCLMAVDVAKYNAMVI